MKLIRKNKTIISEKIMYKIIKYHNLNMLKNNDEILRKRKNNIGYVIGKENNQYYIESVNVKGLILI